MAAAGVKLTNLVAGMVVKFTRHFPDRGTGKGSNMADFAVFEGLEQTPGGGTFLAGTPSLPHLNQPLTTHPQPSIILTAYSWCCIVCPIFCQLLANSS